MFTSLFATIVLAGNGFTPAPEPDPRWQAWLGCWQPSGTMGRGARESGSIYLACVIPTVKPSAVEVVTIERGEVAGRETINISGSHEPNSRGGCTGWESADWSPEQSRVYLTSEQDCGRGLARKSGGLMSITASGDWLDVRGLASGGNAGVRVLRYQPVDLDEVTDRIPTEVVDALRDRIEAIATARMAAGRRLSVDDVIEASRRLDANVVEAWLIENRQGFAVDGRDLTRLADAGVPGRVTDIMIALSYPRVFAINRDSRQSEFRAPERPEDAPEAYPDPGVISVWDPFGYSPWGYRYPYGYGLGGYGYGGYGWYAGDRPVIVVSGAEAPSSESKGQAVKGRGYRRGQGDNPPATTGQTERPRSSGGNSSGDSGGSSSSAPASSEGSSGSGRTAHPRN